MRKSKRIIKQGGKQSMTWIEEIVGEFKMLMILMILWMKMSKDMKRG